MRSGALHQRSPLRQVPAQWDASLLTKDPLFATNANYVRDFNRSAGYIPTHITASGTAAAMALCVRVPSL